MELYKYQEDIINKALSSQYPKGCILDMEMGLGKTITSLSIIQRKQSMCLHTTNLLIICKTTLFDGWKRECKLLNRPIEVLTKKTTNMELSANYLVSIDMLVNLWYLIEQKHWDFIILDECTDIKSLDPMARYTEKIIHLCHQAKYSLLLTGTLLTNSNFDVYNAIQCISPGLLGTKEQFYTNYFDPDYVGPGKPKRNKRVLPNTATDLSQKVNRYRIKLRKQDIGIQLPKQYRELVKLHLSPDKLVKTIMLQEELKHVRSRSPKEQQIILQLSREATVAKLDHAFCWLKTKLASTNEDEQMIVFSEDIASMDYLEKKLQCIGYSTLVINASRNASKKDLFIRSFCETKQPRIALLGLKCCCKGLNMETIPITVFLSLCFVPGDMSQAEARTHRITTRMTPSYYYLYGESTFDQQSLRMLVGKDTSHRSIFDGENTVFTFDKESVHYFLSIPMLVSIENWDMVNYPNIKNEPLCEFVRRTCKPCNQVNTDKPVIKVKGLLTPMVLTPNHFGWKPILCYFVP